MFCPRLDSELMVLQLSVYQQPRRTVLWEGSLLVHGRGKTCVALGAMGCVFSGRKVKRCMSVYPMRKGISRRPGFAKDSLMTRMTFHCTQHAVPPLPMH